MQGVIIYANVATGNHTLTHLCGRKLYSVYYACVNKNFKKQWNPSFTLSWGLMKNGVPAENAKLISLVLTFILTLNWNESKLLSNV
jgi:hypothetical protein